MEFGNRLTLTSVIRKYSGFTMFVFRFSGAFIDACFEKQSKILLAVGA